ncbi:MAG TPA: hypothetical protein VIM16_14285 [Mucilaginibacter sp.]|jgi:hypothetical protein
MELPIKNIDNLRMEIFRLQGLEQEQGIALGKRFNTPAALLSTLFSLFPKSTADGEKSTGFFHQDIVGLVSRFVLPLVLNKTIFRNSNFVVKTLVGILSQKASHFISEESLTGLWDKVKSLFTSKSDDIPEHRAIPAFSETY